MSLDCPPQMADIRPDPVGLLGFVCPSDEPETKHGDILSGLLKKAGAETGWSGGTHLLREG